MKALVITEPTGPSGIHVAEVPDPTPRLGEVVVAIEAAGINHLDLLSSWGRVGAQQPASRVPGIEGAGTVVGVGKGVDEERLGEAVSIYPYVGCGRCRQCHVGEDQICSVGQIRCIGLTLAGTLAERVVVPVRNAIPLPERISSVEAAAMSMTGMTALRLLVHHGRIGPADVVLVRAVGSGVGVMALQIAKMCGATVIGSAGTREKLAQASELGMDHGIDHAEENVPQRVKELTGGVGADLVVDYVGAATFRDSMRSLARGGRLAICGAHTGASVEVDLWHLFAKEQRVIGSYGGNRDELRRVLDLAAEGRLRAVIDELLPLEAVQRGLEKLELRAHFGKLVVTLGSQ
jgi:NADPH:quinone reductase-like Zn-dependent oxidoreductase